MIRNEVNYVFSSPEPQTIDFQLEINFKHALTVFLSRSLFTKDR